MLLGVINGFHWLLNEGIISSFGQGCFCSQKPSRKINSSLERRPLLHLSLSLFFFFFFPNPPCPGLTNCEQLPAGANHNMAPNSQNSIRRPNPILPDSVFKMFDMSGKVVIITGGSGGIGYQVGRALAEAGANVALWYSKSTQAQERAATIAKDFGVKCKSYQCRVQDFNEVRANSPSS